MPCSNDTIFTALYYIRLYCTMLYYPTLYPALDDVMFCHSMYFELIVGSELLDRFRGSGEPYRPYKSLHPQNRAPASSKPRRPHKKSGKSPER